MLILLLVYHFKQRLSHLEHKSETVVQIINNIVKEINNMRNYFSMTEQGVNKSLNNVTYSIQESNYGTYSNPYKVGEFDNNLNEDLEDDEDDEEEDDEDDDEEDDEDDEEEDDDEENDDEDDDENVNETDPNLLLSEIQEVIMDDTELTEEIKEIKVINVGTSLETENEIHADDINSDDCIEPLETDEQEESVEIQEDNEIHVEKINTTDLEKETLENSGEITKESSREVYQKMTVQALKTLVISKGLCSDSSKMKKPELLKLLESSEDV